MPFLEAIVGVLWPPKTAEWARWQRIGIVLAIFATLAFAAAIAVGYLYGWTNATFWAVIVGSLFALVYLVIGNVCRRYHEAETQRETAN
jgi:small-conductance mechanosensitive channel